MIVGIDLGTTNSALAHTELGARLIEVDPILQLVSAGEVSERPTLPSFLYLSGEHELPESAIALPFGAPSRNLVGEFARQQGSQVPARMVSSAKSWLCHPHVNRLAAILPWGEAESAEIKRISPVAASAAYLRHLSEAWHHKTGQSLTEQEVVLCVPASFDEVARELTLKAAAEVGLKPILLEEPQAAFYSWLADHANDWQNHLSPGDTVLVFDVGGGTTDFSLISVRQPDAQGRPVFDRTAVGDHLLLGGDNMDLAIARQVEERLGRKLDPHSFQALVQACRVGKERLLGDATRDSWSITVAGRSSKLIGGALHAEITRSDVEALVLDGFFPRVDESATPTRARTGLQEFGLPYAAEPGITRHAAAFLRSHAARPTAILWNGGVLNSSSIRARILEVLASWLGATPKVLESAALDLAVARGAAYYGLARHGAALRIAGGAARAYYLGLDTAQVNPGGVTTMCITPRGFEEGASVELSQHPLELLTNRPVRFRLFSSSERMGDQAGALITVDEGVLVELPPVYTVVRFSRTSQDATLSVNVRARLTEVGTLELECVARSTGNESDRWKLNFDLRDDARVEEPAPSHQNVEKLDEAIVLLRSLYGKGEGDPAGVMKALQSLLGPKDSWSMTVLRGLWEPLKDLRGGRGKTAAHEARWMNLVGYTLRPGFGYPLDDWRVKETWRLFNLGLVHDKDDPCRLEWWILWRRISGGLTKTQQEELFKRIAPHFLPTFARRAERKTPSTQESAEMWRCVASMERLTARQKIELGDVLIQQLEKKRAPEQAMWALGRLAARVPLYGPTEDVVLRSKAERWLEQILALDWSNDNFALAAAEIGRASGDRARDLDESLRRKLAERLRKSKDGERMARSVLEPVPREARDEKLAFGEALPSGLRLAEQENAPS